MLNVTFLRHAKSNLSSYDGDDFTRDISEIGKQKTKKVGRFLKKKKIVFDEILCSPALRTKKRTLDIISVFFLNKPKIKYIEELYHNSKKNLFEVLMLNAQKKCLVISHEPLLSCSIESFFLIIKTTFLSEPLEKYSTSSLFDVSFMSKLV